ncbi:MAG: nucleotidyl transferase AbiEii/AbiGii toxin family protein [Planctomycetota bacterium]|nr:nucleotidyl transferase AbiEii/AbiGii toxin family protein [Planctomycetota bacterium]
MSRREPKDLAASVHRRLLNRSRDRDEDFKFTLTRYAIERFLFRLSKSAYADRFALKGAMLFPLWGGETYRPTRDVDMLAFGDSSAEWLSQVVREVCGVQVPPDGLEFDAKSVTVDEIRGNQEYPGLHARVVAHLGSARVVVQVDVGYGDAVTPDPSEKTYPTLLADMPAPKVRVYPPEAVVAEKLEAMVRFGPVFSRMKDLYDLWWISQQFEFTARTLADAVRATFTRRRTEIPVTLPHPLTDEFVSSAEAARRWKGFLDTHGLADEAPALDAVVTHLRTFLLPVLEAARTGKVLAAWPRGGPWSE